MSEHDIRRIVSSSRHDWTEDMLRACKRPGVFADEPPGILPDLRPNPDEARRAAQQEA